MIIINMIITINMMIIIIIMIIINMMIILIVMIVVIVIIIRGVLPNRKHYKKSPLSHLSKVDVSHLKLLLGSGSSFLT